MAGRGAGRSLAKPAGKHPKSSDFDRMSSEMKMNVATLGAIVEQMKTKLAAVEAELKADRDSIAELKNDLRRLHMERALVTARLEKSREWASKFDKEIGPFSSQYDGLAEDIGTLYESAKKKHARGLVVLMNEFDYHPAFRRGPDDFFAIPFRPK